MTKAYAKNDNPENIEGLSKQDYRTALENLNIDFAKPVVTLLIDNTDKEIEKKINNMAKPKNSLESYIYRKLKSSVNMEVENSI